MRLLGVILAVGAAAVAAAGVGAAPAHFTLSGPVLRVVDGDTIDVRAGGRRERVRIIGVDTPERGACYSARATAETHRLTAGKVVRLAGDRSQARRDRYGRLLAYVSAPGAPDVGKRLVERGLARVLVVGRPFRRVAAYRAAEQRAQRSPAGLWAACAEPPPRDGLPEACAASYPDFCVPPPPPDRDCADFPQRGFRVLWDVPSPDPHRLDGNRDGVACEG
jgi:micrococcal nuclease